MESGRTFDSTGKPGGDKRTVNLREIVNGLMYVLSTGCQWRAIPKDLPPKSTVYDYFDLWTYDGTLDRIHHALYQQCREQEQREASPTAAIIDSLRQARSSRGQRPGTRPDHASTNPDEAVRQAGRSRDGGGVPCLDDASYITGVDPF